MISLDATPDFSGSSWFGSRGKTYRSSQWFSKFLPFWADCCKDCGLVSRAGCCRDGDLTVYGLAIFHLCIWYSVALQDIFSHNLVSKGSPLSWSYRFYQTRYLGVMKDMAKKVNSVNILLSLRRVTSAAAILYGIKHWKKSQIVVWPADQRQGRQLVPTEEFILFFLCWKISA